RRATGVACDTDRVPISTQEFTHGCATADAYEIFLNLARAQLISRAQIGRRAIEGQSSLPCVGTNCSTVPLHEMRNRLNHSRTVESNNYLVRTEVRLCGREGKGGCLLRGDLGA